MPGTFISEEITTYFPDDGCKVHVLALNISETQHEDIQKIRADIFDLARYLYKQHIVAVAAHPLYAINDRNEMQSSMANLPFHPCGYLAGEELARVYASADLFVFPSNTDTFGNVVLEAQASGLPVVVTDKGGPCENMIPEKTGVVAPADDPEALSAAPESMLCNIPRHREMARAARKYAQQRSFEAAFLKTWNMYSAKAPDPSLPGSFFKVRLSHWCPSTNRQICSRYGTRAENLTAGIWLIFRGLNFSRNADIGQIGHLWMGTL